MVYATSSLRWGIGLWCALSGALIIGSAVQGAGPMSIGFLVVGTVVPVAVVAALTRFRPEARTAAQVLHDDPARR
jgi:hypothetical protein